MYQYLESQTAHTMIVTCICGMKAIVYKDSVDASHMHVLLGQLSEQSLSIDSLFPQLTSSRTKARIDVLQESRKLLKTKLLTSHLKEMAADKCLS